MNVWEFENGEQKDAMEEAVTPANCGAKLKLVREVSGLSRKELAASLGCSESTLMRIETRKSEATSEFMNRLRALTIIGYHKFKTLTDAEKATVNETLSVAGGVATGIGGSIAAVSASGSVAGLSAAGITSGLAAIGGGSLLGGVGVVAAIPAAVGLAGYGLVKGIQSICEANSLGVEEIDGKYEIAPVSQIQKIAKSIAYEVALYSESGHVIHVGR